MAMRMTTSRNGKIKESLSDIHQIRQAVKLLQKESNDQLQLERESQATFDFLQGEVKAMKNAFATLSDVVMAEMDSMRKNTIDKCRNLEGIVDTQSEMLKHANHEIGQLKRTLEVWSMKERDWAKDNEILKGSHAHHVEWMQQLQRDVMKNKEDVHSCKQEYLGKVKDVMEETNGLRRNWEEQVDVLEEKMNTMHVQEEKVMVQVRDLSTQRLEDLELMERALGTVQRQQGQLKSSVNQVLESIHAENGQLQHRQETVESNLHGLSNKWEQVRSKIANVEREQRQRYESITKIFAVFADALHITPPNLYPSSIAK